MSHLPRLPRRWTRGAPDLASDRSDRGAIAGPSWGYPVAVTAVASVLLVRQGLIPEATDTSPFMAFGLVVMLIALVAGLGPGLLAALLSAAMAVYFFLPPRNALGVDEPMEVIVLGFFMVEWFVAALAGGVLRGYVIHERVERGGAGNGDERGGLTSVASDGPPANRRGRIEDLTERELDVARLLALGLANERIATVLFVSRNTVKTHLQHIYGKLGVETRTEAVARCFALGIVAPPWAGDAIAESEPSSIDRGTRPPV
jgi:DNA-binding CsgD family transcriptional regulator